PAGAFSPASPSAYGAGGSGRDRLKVCPGLKARTAGCFNTGTATCTADGPATLRLSDAGRGTAPPSCSRPHGRGARAYPGAARARPEPFGARGLLAALVRALRLQALGAPAQAAALGGRSRPPGAGRERRRD